MKQVGDGKYIIGGAKIELPQPHPIPGVLTEDPTTHGYVEVAVNRELESELFSGIIVSVFQLDGTTEPNATVPTEHYTDGPIIVLPYELFAEIESELISTEIPAQEYSSTETGVSIDTTHIGKENQLDPRDILIDTGYILNERMYVSDAFSVDEKIVNRRDSKGYRWNECNLCQHTTTVQTLQEYTGVDPVVISDLSQGHYLNTRYVFDKLCFLKILLSVRAILNDSDSKKLFVELV